VWRRPWRRGGPARTSGSRWRPKPIRLRFSFGLQEQAALKRTPRLKFIRSRRESSVEVGVQNLSRCCVTVFGPMARVSCWSPIGARPGGLARPKPLLIAAAAIVRLGVLLRFILSRTVVAVHRFVKPQLVRLIIHLQSHSI